MTKPESAGDSRGQLPPCSKRSYTRAPKKDFPETGPQLSPTVPVQKWDVNRISSLAIGRKLGRITAATRAKAEELARAQWGRDIWVTIAGGSPKRRRIDPFDIGNSTRRKA